MRRKIFDDTHELFRSSVRTFLTREAAPNYSTWEEDGAPSKEFFRRAGDAGFLGVQVPEVFGGSGQTSFRYNAIVTEEVQRLGMALGGLRLHTDIVMPYFLHVADEVQRRTWLPKLVSGEAISAIAMSEPNTGSDLRSISTVARREDHHWVLNGAKTFISNGSIADVVIVVARTSPPGEPPAHSLFIVSASTPGFAVGRRLSKIGLKAQDLAELSFTDLGIPRENLLGVEGQAMRYLKSNLAQERLSIALNSQAAAEAAIATTVEYVKQRHAFGRPISDFQNTKFELAACATDAAAGRALADAALDALDDGELSPEDAAATKLFCTEMQGRVVDRCLQLFGGYGYMSEYPISSAFVDSRVSRIYGGSSEIMKVIVAKSLGL